MNSNASSIREKYTPLLNKVIIKTHKPDETSKGGIVLPASSQGKTDRGVVVSVGPGVRNKEGDIVPISIDVGAVVIFEAFNPTILEDGVYIVGSHEIICELKE